MALITILNRSLQSLPLPGNLGVIYPNKKFSKSLPAAEIEAIQDALQALDGSGLIEFQVSDDPATDPRLEVPTTTMATGGSVIWKASPGGAALTARAFSATDGVTMEAVDDGTNIVSRVKADGIDSAHLSPALRTQLASFPRAVPTGRTQIFVASTGNDTTGDGTQGNPFLTVGRALREHGTYGTTVPGNMFQICVVAPYQMSVSDPNFQGMWALFERQRSNDAYATEVLHVDAWAPPASEGTVADPRFQTLIGPVSPTAVGTEAGRVKLTLPAASFTTDDQYFGRTLRVFDGTTGLEKYRAPIGLMRAATQEIVAESYADGYSPNPTITTSDIVYVVKQTVLFDPAVAQYLELDGYSDGNILFRGIEFTWGVTDYLNVNDVGFLGCFFAGYCDVAGGGNHHYGNYGAVAYSSVWNMPFDTAQEIAMCKTWGSAADTTINGGTIQEFDAGSTNNSRVSYVEPPSVLRGLLSCFGNTGVKNLIVDLTGGGRIKGRIFAQSGTYLATGRSYSGAQVATIISGRGNATDPWALWVQASEYAGVWPTLIDASTFTGTNVVVFEGAQQEGRFMSFNAYPVGSATLTGGPAIRFIRSERVMLTPGTLLGAGGVDIVVGNLPGMSYTDLTNCKGVIDVSTGTEVVLGPGSYTQLPTTTETPNPALPSVTLAAARNPLQSSDMMVFVDTTNAAVPITIPAGLIPVGSWREFTKINAAGNAWSIIPPGTVSINGTTAGTTWTGPTSAGRVKLQVMSNTAWYIY